MSTSLEQDFAKARQAAKKRATLAQFEYALQRMHKKWENDNYYNGADSWSQNQAQKSLSLLREGQELAVMHRYSEKKLTDYCQRVEEWLAILPPPMSSPALLPQEK